MSFKLTNPETYTVQRLQEIASQNPQLQAEYIKNLHIEAMKEDQRNELEVNIYFLTDASSQELKKKISAKIQEAKTGTLKKQEGDKTGKQSNFWRNLIMAIIVLACMVYYFGSTPQTVPQAQKIQVSSNVQQN